MTTEQMQELAEAICELDTNEWEDFADILFDQVVATHTEEQQDMILNDLLSIGVDVRGLCRKKHPTTG